METDQKQVSAPESGIDTRSLSVPGRIWRIGHAQRCIFCLSPFPSLNYKIDRRGSPMLHCCACGTRSFLKTQGFVGPEKLFGAMVLSLSDNNVEAAIQILEVGSEAVYGKRHGPGTTDG